MLRESALSHNLALMARYAERHGFLLAPHAKTTLSPQLIRRQLDAGAWGATVANATQVAVAVRAGARRVLVANEVVAATDAALLVAQARSGAELYCLVDSVRGVELLDGALGAACVAPTREQGAQAMPAESFAAGEARSRPVPPRLGVLVELGRPGGRCGVRTVADAVPVAEAVSRALHLDLVGVEGYEGVVGADRSQAVLDEVDRYLGDVRELVGELGERGLLESRTPVLVSAGGSRFFDRVAAVLGDRSAYGALEVHLVVRSGCYLTHDHGAYAAASPLAGTGRPGEGLVPALEAWAEVLSVPEPGLAIVGLGKRDVPYDLGLPVPLHLARGRGPVVDLAGGRVTALDDQHGYLRDASDGAGDLLPGDRVGFGLSHPCTAFDKWEVVPVVDDDWRVVDAVRTYFG